MNWEIFAAALFVGFHAVFWFGVTVAFCASIVRGDAKNALFNGLMLVLVVAILLYSYAELDVLL